MIDRTPLWPFLFMDGDRDLFTQSRDRTLFTLDRLAQIARDPRPTLTFAHYRLSPPALPLRREW